MQTPAERILLIENDPETRYLIAHQILQPMGLHVDAVDSASSALQDIEKFDPDIIITNLLLPGISCKDLLIALNSQGFNIPTIVITPKGHESDALQAFRLGAINFLTYPIREAEVVSVVEATLKQVQKQNELHHDTQLMGVEKSSVEQRVQHMAEIFSIARLLPSATSQQVLYEKITNTAALVTEADSAWMVVFDFYKKKYILRACQDVSEDIASKYNLPYENDLSNVVAVTGQAVSVHGEILARNDQLLQVKALLIVPISLKEKEEVIGMLSVARRSPKPFTRDQQAMLETLAEYTLYLLGNSRRYQALEQRVFQLEHENIYTILDSNLKNDLLHQASVELRNPLKALTESLDMLLSQGDSKFTRKQNDSLISLQEETDVLLDIADSISDVHHREAGGRLEDVDLNELVRESINHFQGIAQLAHVSFKTETPPQPVMVTVFPTQVSKVIEGAISNALKYGPAKAQITIQVEQQQNKAILSVSDCGNGVEERQLNNLFNKKSSLLGDEAQRFGGIGISMPMMKQIIAAHGGEIWVESERSEQSERSERNKHRKGFTLKFSLPL